MHASHHSLTALCVGLAGFTLSFPAQAAEPSLVVSERSGQRGGQVGLFAAGGQPAYFTNLRIMRRP